MKNKGTEFTFHKSFFVDNAAFLFLSRDDIEKGGKLVSNHFRRFGFTVHSGDKSTKTDSKTEAMFIPGAGRTKSKSDTADIMIGDTKYFSYCDEFKYLGTTITTTLRDEVDIEKRIKQATKAFAAMEKTLCDQKINPSIRVKIYEATVVNILLWGCESWALTEKLREKLEVYHNRFLRRMAKINTHDAKENHITNESVREALNCRTLHQSMELKRSKWLQKLALSGYDRNPRKILKAWLPDVPRPVGGPQQSTKKSHRNTF